MRMTIDMIQGMVTRWKNSRMLAKKKPKLSDSTWLNDSFSHDLASLRFFAGALLGGAERVGQPLRGAARA